MPEPLLKISTRTRCAAAVIAIAGDLDLNALPDFVAAVEQVLDAGADLVTIDAGDVTFADSSGVQALLRGQAVAQARDAKFQLVNVSGALQRTLSLAGLDDLSDGVKA